MTMYSWTANQQGHNMLQLQFSVMCPPSCQAISSSFPPTVARYESRSAEVCNDLAAASNRRSPRRWIVNPAAADHCRHDFDFLELLGLAGERIPVEHGEIRVVPGQE